VASSFRFAPGRQAAALQAALPQHLKPSENGARDYLDLAFWASGHAKGLTRARLNGAASWLFTRAYVTGGIHLASDAAVLAEQARIIAAAGLPNVQASHVAYLVAAAAVRWAAGEPLPHGPLDEAAALAEGLHGPDGIRGVLATFPRDAGWQRLLALTVVLEVSLRGMRGDWGWIEAAWPDGLDYLDGLKKPAPAGLLVRFWKRLAEVVAASEAGRAGAVDACREALQELAASWAAALIASEPWDGSPTLLYLAAWGFERHAVGQEPTAAEVNAGLRGDP
jgi:hypothetical protein